MLAAATFLLGAHESALAATHRAGQLVMGTVLEVTVVAGDDTRARTLADASIEVARHWDDVLTTWRPQGELERLNESAGRGAVAVSADLAGALRSMLALSRVTSGAFDPAVGGVVDALRRGATAPAAPVGGGLARALTVDGEQATLAAGVRLDAGAIGKGIALDAIARHLASHDALAWFLDFGGSSQLAHGAPETAPAWTVLIADEAGADVHGAVNLTAGSLSTSRAHEASDPAGAIVDPRTATPVAPPRLATVLAADAASADAWSTALIVLGRDGIDEARAAGLELLYEDSAGRVVTPGFPLRR